MSSNAAFVNVDTCSANLFPSRIAHAVVLTVILEGINTGVLALGNTVSMGSTRITRKIACSIEIFAHGNVSGRAVHKRCATSSLGAIVSDVTAFIICDWAHHNTLGDKSSLICITGIKPRVGNTGFNVLAV
jgi:hypothetical protein